jgi:membrane protease YdiL (CAAX protease family)
MIGRRPAASGTGQPGAGVVAIGMALAMPAFAATFRGPREQFWSRMTATGLILGGFSLLASPQLRRTRIRPRDVAVGLAVASSLYVTFRAGDRFARRFVPGGGGQIQDIYSLRELGSEVGLAARLITVVAPAEELFWRGLVQQALMARYGRWRGAVMATLAYSAAHVSSGNFTLFGAAGVAGAYWSILYAGGVPLGALVVSHSVWDVWIFLIQPTQGAAATGGASGMANEATAAGRLDSSGL